MGQVIFVMQLPNNGWCFLTECIRQWLTQPFMGWGDWDQFCNVRICIYSINYKQYIYIYLYSIYIYKQYIYIYIFIQYIYTHVYTHTSLGISPSLLKVSCETQCMEFVELSYQTYIPFG